MSPAIIFSLTTLRDTGKLRWYAGMLTTRHGRVLRITSTHQSDGSVFTALFVPFLCDDADEMAIPDDDAIPDTDDPVTALAFELMAQEAWDDPTLYGACVITGDRPWGVRSRDYGSPFNRVATYRANPTFATRIEALIAAILAAPEKA